MRVKMTLVSSAFWYVTAATVPISCKRFASHEQLGTTNLWNGTKGENTDALISSFNHVLRKHFKKSHLKYTVSSNARLIGNPFCDPVLVCR